MKLSTDLENIKICIKCHPELSPEELHKRLETTKQILAEMVPFVEECQADIKAIVQRFSQAQERDKSFRELAQLLETIETSQTQFEGQYEVKDCKSCTESTCLVQGRETNYMALYVKEMEECLSRAQVKLAALKSEEGLEDNAREKALAEREKEVAKREANVLKAEQEIKEKLKQMTNHSQSDLVSDQDEGPDAELNRYLGGPTMMTEEVSLKAKLETKATELDCKKQYFYNRDADLVAREVALDRKLREGIKNEEELKNRMAALKSMEELNAKTLAYINIGIKSFHNLKRQMPRRIPEFVPFGYEVLEPPFQESNVTQTMIKVLDPICTNVKQTENDADSLMREHQQMQGIKMVDDMKREHLTNWLMGQPH